MVNLGYEVTAPILNPESVAWYEGLYDVGHCHTADTRQKTKHPNVFSELLA
jgi:hypothetical protein